MKQIAVIGLGNFGSAFAKRIHQLGREVLAIDSRKEVIQAIGDELPRAVLADARDARVLKELGLADMDLAVVSLGQSIDASTLVTLHLRSLGVKAIYVKAISDEHSKILELVGATRVIHPEREVAEKLATSVIHPNIVDYLPLLEDFTILEILAPKDYHGKNLIELGLRRKFGVTIIAINQRSTHKKFVAPAPTYTIGEDDELVLLGENQDIQRFQASIEEE